MKRLLLCLLAGTASAQTTTTTVPITVTTTPTSVTLSMPTTTIPVPVAPVCPPQPPSTTTTQACPAGTTGSWQQTTTFNSAPAPVCWLPSISPLGPPAGACTPIPTISACPVTKGPLTVNAKATRANGIAPLLVFFDATATTDTSLGSNKNTFESVTYSWSFGDTPGTWAFGSGGNMSTNLAYGPIAAHAYMVADGAGDKPFTTTVTATDGTNSASCTIPVTAYDPIGSNGYGVQKYYFNSSAGTGFPSGATGTQATTVPSLAISNTRILFKCGDTFTTAQSNISGTKGAIDRYGNCTGSNNPIIQATAATDGILTLTNPSTDIRISNLTLDGNNKVGVVMIDNQNGGTINGGNKPFQITMLGLAAKNQASAFRWNAAGQMGIINSTAGAVQTNSPYINVFPNFAGVGNSGSTLWTTSGASEDYLFMSGNSFTNGVAGNNEYETVRDSYASKHIISNNLLTNAGPSYAILKFHNLNFATNGSGGGWSGLFSQNNVISDNMLVGSSGAQCLEISPQNPQSDERIQLMLIERNLLKCTENFGRQALISGVHITVRDNAFVTASGSNGVQAAQRGIEPAPQFVSIYNNTFSGGSPTAAVALNQSGNSGTTAASNSVVQNNLIFGAGVPSNSGTGNTISNNTVNTALNPSFTNGSGSFSLMSDFKPTANYSGALSPVPVAIDAVATPWPTQWDLGALHH
jgi:hypothetical protein